MLLTFLLLSFEKNKIKKTFHSLWIFQVGMPSARWNHHSDLLDIWIENQDEMVEKKEIDKNLAEEDFIDNNKPSLIFLETWKEKEKEK